MQNCSLGYIQITCIMFQIFEIAFKEENLVNLANLNYFEPELLSSQLTDKKNLLFICLVAHPLKFT